MAGLSEEVIGLSERSEWFIETIHASKKIRNLNEKINILYLDELNRPRISYSIAITTMTF